MAGSFKGFYRQRKTLKHSSKKSLKSSKKSTNPAPLISHGAPDLLGDYDGNEELLRQFDMNLMYGPCIGISRLARWERAFKLGLNPSQEIGKLLQFHDKVQKESLWDSRLT